MSDPTEPSETNPDDTPVREGEPGRVPDPGPPRTGLLGGRLVATLGAVAVGIVAAVVIMSVTGDSDDDATGPSDTRDIAAGSTTTTDAADGTTPPTTWQMTTADGFEISLGSAKGALATITVRDPATPTVDGQDPQHCVLVTLVGPSTVETFGCAPVATDSAGDQAVELTPSTPGEPLIGCAATVTRETGTVGTPLDATSRFVIPDDAELPAGDYGVTVVAVSGAGDGCPPADGVTEHEATTETSITVS